MMQRLYTVYRKFLTVKKKHSKYEKYRLEETGSENFRMIRDKLEILDEEFTESLLFIEKIGQLLNDLSENPTVSNHTPVK